MIWCWLRSLVWTTIKAWQLFLIAIGLIWIDVEAGWVSVSMTMALSV
jgi:hypothetical protein